MHCASKPLGKTAANLTLEKIVVFKEKGEKMVTKITKMTLTQVFVLKIALKVHYVIKQTI